MTECTLNVDGRYIVAAAATHCDILARATRDSLRAVREEVKSFDSESTTVHKSSPSLLIIGSGNGGPCIDLRYFGSIIVHTRVSRYYKSTKLS